MGFANAVRKSLFDEETTLARTGAAEKRFDFRAVPSFQVVNGDNYIDDSLFFVCSEVNIPILVDPLKPAQLVQLLNALLEKPLVKNVARSNSQHAEQFFFRESVSVELDFLNSELRALLDADREIDYTPIAIISHPELRLGLGGVLNVTHLSVCFLEVLK